jgi:hypothetical protein
VGTEDFSLSLSLSLTHTHTHTHTHVHTCIYCAPRYNLQYAGLAISSLGRLGHVDAQLVDGLLSHASKRAEEAYTKDLAAVCKVSFLFCSVEFIGSSLHERPGPCGIHGWPGLPPSKLSPPLSSHSSLFPSRCPGPASQGLSEMGYASTPEWWQLVHSVLMLKLPTGRVTASALVG